MSVKISHIHHIGHVVEDMNNALNLYRKLGFTCPPPSYGTLSEKNGEPPKPIGAANTHVTFLRNFVEIATVVEDGKPIPDDAKLLPLQVPAGMLDKVLKNIKNTVEKLSKCLLRYEGTHILCFLSPDVEVSAKQFDKDKVGHSGVNLVSRPIETTDGVKVVPLRVVEIDREDVPEGRLAIADNPPIEVLHAQTHMDHPNGAIELVEVILCVTDSELDNFTSRYQRYLDCSAQKDGTTRFFVLDRSRVTIIPETSLDRVLPGEKMDVLPGFVGYAVTVKDLKITQKYLEEKDVSLRGTPAGDIFVPASSALGTAIVFRQSNK